MFTECREILIQCLKDSGIKNKIHTSRKTLRNCNESRVSAVLFEDEQIEKDGSKRIYVDSERKKRRKKYSRNITFNVVIGEYTIDDVQIIYEKFMEKIPGGIYVAGNYVELDPKQADWLDDEDSILKSKCAVQITVTCSGGIYTDTEFKQITDAEVTVTKGAE